MFTQQLKLNSGKGENMKSVIAAVASMFFGMAYTLPKPWFIVAALVSAILVIILRSI